MRVSPHLLPGAAKRLVQIDTALQAAYGTPEAELGNKDDPLDEAIYIILSLQTDLRRFRSTWCRLRMAYPTWDAMRRAHVREAAHVLREGGLQRQKARTIKRLLAEVDRIAGELSLDLVRNMADDDAERTLTRLPGLSWKAARCVLLYSLGRQVFPVDGNIFRILKRTGIFSLRAVYRRRSLHDAVQAAVAAHRRRALHVNLVVHGQRTCLPRDPQCSRCPLLAMCPQAGLPMRSDTRTRHALRRSPKQSAREVRQRRAEGRHRNSQSSRS